MATVTLSISGDSPEVIAVIRSLAQGDGHGEAPAASDDDAAAPAEVVEEAPAPPQPRAPAWTAESARETRNNVSADGRRLLDALARAPDNQMHIDDIYSQLSMDRYGLIGARRSISAALRRNAATANTTLLTTRDRRVNLDSGFAQALEVETPTRSASWWGQLPQYT